MVYILKRGLALTAACALACAGLSAMGQTAPPSAPPAASTSATTLESFAAPPFIEGPELSPNGQFYAAKLSVKGGQLLAILSLFDSTAKPVLVNLESSKISVDNWQWVNNDWLLLWVSATDSVEGEKWRISRVMSLSRETGILKPLLFKEGGQDAGDVVWIANDGTPRIKLAVQSSIYEGEEFWPQVFEVDVSTGKSKVDTKRRTNIMNYLADATGAVRLGSGYDRANRTERMIYRSSGKGEFHTADRANLAKDEDLMAPAMFLAAPDKAVTYDNPDGFGALYALDLKTMERGEKLFGVDKFDIGGLVPNTAGDAVAGVRVTENRQRIVWLDPGMKQTQADLDKAVGAGNAQIVSWDRTMQKLMIKVGGPDQAGSFFMFDRGAGGKMSRIAYIDEKLKMRKLGQVSTINYRARDGLDIPAVLTLPNDRPAKALPLILFPHGGPQARDRENWDWMTQYFAWRGYAVIQPNYRGSTGFGKAHYSKGFGEWGLKMQDDLNDAVTHLADKGMVDPKRVCIAGASYGGYAAMRGAQRDGGLFRCAISYAGVSDLAALARFDRRSLYGREYVAGLKEKAPDLPGVSPLRFPEQFTTPILLMHGKLDLRVPVEQSRDMAGKLKAAGKTYRYIEQPLADHHFSRKEDRLQFLQEADAFLARYNPADGPPLGK